MKTTLEQKLNKLPRHLLHEVEDFVNFLLETKVYRNQKQLRLSWAGGLKEFRDQFTSLELQKNHFNGVESNVFRTSKDFEDLFRD